MASSEDRIRLVADALLENEWSSFPEASRALEDGAVFLYPDEQLTASTRWQLLLAAKQRLKKRVDGSITLRIEPMDDNNALRGLRGVTFVTDGDRDNFLPMSSFAKAEEKA
jgi:hypothetical protein